MIYIRDCVEFMKEQQDDCFSAVVTSPPYNIGVDYGCYSDNLPFKEYRAFTKAWLKEAVRVAPVVVINFGCKTSNPVALCNFGVWCQQTAHLQQMIAWAKSVYVAGTSFGHYKPVNSERYLSNLYEMIYIVSRTGDYKLDKMAVGVPYEDKSNIARRGHKQDLRDRGNVWVVPYETRQTKKEHPATYPVKLAEMMIKITGAQGVIYDPFIGSGTTKVACERLGLECVGTDLKHWSCKPQSPSGG